MSTCRHHLRHEIERAARRVLPERPLAVVLASEVPPAYRRDETHGWVAPHMDLAFGVFLPGRFRGRCAAITLNDKALWQVDRWRPGRNWPRFSSRMWATAIHELAHVAEGPRVANELIDMPADVGPVLVESLRESCSRPLPEATDYPVPWVGHGGDFVRLYFHVAHRMRRLAGDVAGDVVPDLNAYGLSHGRAYRTALDDEPERLEHLPLSRIAREPAPREFVELWRGDLVRWFTLLPIPSTAQTDAFCTGVRVLPLVTTEETMSVMEAIRSQFQARKNQKETNYVSLVRRLGAGEQVAADEVVASLEHLGKYTRPVGEPMYRLLPATCGAASADRQYC